MTTQEQDALQEQMDEAGRRLVEAVQAMLNGQSPRLALPDDAPEVMRALAARLSVLAPRVGPPPPRPPARAQTGSLANSSTLRRELRQQWSDYMAAVGADEAGQVLADLWPNMREAQRAGQTVHEVNGRSALSVPVRVADETIGVMGFASDGEQVWEEDDIAAVEAIVEQVGLALENQRLFEQTQQALAQTEAQAHRLALLNELGQQLSTAADPENIFTIAVTSTRAILEASRASLTLFDDSGQNYTVMAVDGETGDTTVNDRTPADGSALAQAAAENRIIVVDAYENESMPGIGSFAIAPMFSGGRIIGTINVGWAEPGGLDAADESLMTQIGSLLASTIDNYRLFQQTERALAETERQARRLTLLNEMSEQLSRSNSLTGVYDVTAEKIGQIFTADRVTLTLLNEEGDKAEVIALQGDSGTVPVGLYQPIAGTLTERVVKERNVVVLYDDEPQGAEQIHSSMIVPLITSRGVIGTINVGSKALNAYVARDESLITQLASLVSAAIEDRRLFEQIEEALDEAKTLYDASTQLNAAATLEDTLAASVAPAARGGAVAAALWLFELDESLRPVSQVRAARWGRPIKGETQPLAPTDLPLPAQQQDGGQALLMIGDVAADESLSPAGRERLAAAGAAALVYLPLTSAQRPVGFVTIQWDEPRTFDEADERLYRSLAAQTAAVVEGQLLLHETQARAQQLERLSVVEIALSQVAGEQDILRAVLNAIEGRGAFTATLHYLNETGEGLRSELVSLWDNGRFDAEATGSELAEPAEAVASRQLSTLWLDRPNEVLTVADIQQDERATRSLKREAKKEGWRAAAVLPLSSGGRWQGLVTLTWPEVHRFTDAERFIFPRLLEPLAAVVASRRASLAAQATRAETENLYRTSRRINEAISLPDILAATVEAGAIASVDQATIWSFERDTANSVTGARVVAAWRRGTAESDHAVGARLSRDDFATVGDLLAPQATFIGDVSRDERVSAKMRKILRAKGVRAQVILPLFVGTRQIGAVVMSAPQPHEFERREVRAYASLAPQVAIAVENQELLSQAQARARREQMLREITAKVRSSADVDTIVKTAVREVGRAFGREAFIHVQEPASDDSKDS